MTDRERRNLLLVAQAHMRIAQCGLLIALAVGILAFHNHPRAFHFDERPAVCGGAVMRDTPADRAFRERAAKNLESWQQGNALFKANCYACHKLDKVHGGPAVDQAVRRDHAWARLFIVQEDLLLSTGDPFTLELNTKWNSNYTHTFAFADTDLDALMAYLAQGPFLPYSTGR